MTQTEIDMNNALTEIDQLINLVKYLEAKLSRNKVDYDANHTAEVLMSAESFLNHHTNS